MRTLSRSILGRMTRVAALLWAVATSRQVAAQDPATTTIVHGVVVDSDSARSPIPFARVRVTGSTIDQPVDERGAFSIRLLAGRTYTITVVALGFAPTATTLQLALGDSVRLDVQLARRVSVLDPTVVVETDHRLTQFEERRRRGIGTFFTRSQIDDLAADGRLPTVLRRAPGARFTWSRGGVVQILTAGRDARPWSGSGPCYAAVVLDGVWIYRGGPGATPFNLNSIPTSAIAAIEYYRSSAQVPVEFSGLGSECGVLVLYTR